MLRFAAIGVVSLCAVLVYWFSDSARARTVTKVFDTLINGEAEIDQTAFQALSLETVNARRAELGLRKLTPAPEIQDELARYIATHSRSAELQLDPLFRTLQEQFPAAQFLSATVQLNPSEPGLAQSLAEWEDAGNPQYETLSTLAFRDGLRKGCLAVLARQLPPFDLEIANQKGGLFFRTCPLCEAPHSVTLEPQAQSVILACPSCESPYDLLAADTRGAFRRATEFLEEFRLPDSSLVTEDPETTMIRIWEAILRRCDYAHDRSTEAWKRSYETWNEASGDCEDTSILLADALISAGIEARVAVGWNIHIGEHAWCVARIGDRQWVLESTLQPETGQSLSPRTVASVASEYRPEHLFDRQALYVRRGSPNPADCLDYWTSVDWHPLAADRMAGREQAP